ncbi:tetratricopeptide repeat protein [Shewanella schlegeliana]|uniref:Tetratricopeptide repeat protein n=1 Tax=Shewanella schlegeliana TaxID=190308 RepID=A0ABS1SXD4_9GAMM|nr:tetratricopeptide repeat protein [Shewanella schlegeliana]MBL4913015.1 tetratricopeptide repeat protein [Shewanella schlegeliana]MCL1108889.1 tetratricopeptide repeat protein [Shewanella schlegeliana]GIU23818.1 MSHA biogenesis protein MshN [Shewanella schlegeliana]
MSVINKMLKDLDERQQPHGIESMTAPKLAFKPKSSSKRTLLLACVISLAVGGFGTFFALNLMQAEPAIASNQEIAKTEVVDAKVAKAETTKTEAVDAKVAKTVIAKTEIAKTEAVDAKVAKAETTKTEAVDAKVAKTVIAKTEIAETETAKTEAVDAKVVKTETAKAEVVNAKVARADTAKTEAVNAKVAKTEKVRPTQLNIAPATNRSSQLHSSGNMAVKEVKLSPEELAQKQMLLATDAQQQGLHRDALSYYEAALAYNPSLHQARRQAAALYYGQSKLAKAAKLLEQGQLLFPQEYEFSLLLARVLQAGGQDELALKSLAKIPDNSELAIKKWHQQSDLAQAQKNYPVAEQSFRQLAKYEPSQGRWWMGLGYALDAQQKYTEAKAAYSQALSQGNLSAQAKVYVDNRLLQLGAY